MPIDGPRDEGATVPPAPPEAVDVLEIGSGDGGPGGTRSRRSRRGLQVAAATAAALVLGLLAWQLWPRPPAPMSLTELEGVYAGMVRSDGTNDAAQIPAGGAESPDVDPARCRPLFEPTQTGLLPGAVDGMGTYWLSGGGTSMSTYRYPDRKSALRAWDRYRTALGDCTDAEIRQRGTGIRGRLLVTPTGPALTDVDQLGYRLSAGDDSDQQFVFRLVLFNNTVTAVFRLISMNTTYAELPDDQVTASLSNQMKAVQDLRTKR